MSGRGTARVLARGMAAVECGKVLMGGVTHQSMRMCLHASNDIKQEITPLQYSML